MDIPWAQYGLLLLFGGVAIVGFAGGAILTSSRTIGTRSDTTAPGRIRTENGLWAVGVGGAALALAVVEPLLGGGVVLILSLTGVVIGVDRLRP